MPDAPDASALPPTTPVATSRVAALIGFRGCGKTSVARRLAALLNCECVDTDAVIEEASQRNVRDVFELEGEAGFRKLESTALAAALYVTPATTPDRRFVRVVSVGGGAVLLEENRARLRAAAICVWLTAAPATIIARLQADPRTSSLRPALTDMPLDEEVRTLLAQREPLYAALAAITIDTTKVTLDDVARRAAAELTARVSHGGRA